MRDAQRPFILALVAGFSISSLLPRPIQADIFSRFKRQPTNVERLAEHIDDLEEDIETYGTIVAKQPDIWGEARLTKHRREFETVMEKQKDGFTVRLNAALRRSDVAFLANAFALQAVLGGGDDTEVNTGAFGTTSTMISDFNTTNVIPRTAPGALGSVATQAAAATEGVAFGLEPTVELDQMARYLNHLHELRRINEGDDTADSPGYSLNLVRIPVSVLPGKRTQTGYGAEITVTATPYLSDELLPMTFRNLVINDLLDLFGVPIARLADRDDLETLKDEVSAGDAEIKFLMDELNTKRNALNSMRLQADESEALKNEIRRSQEGVLDEIQKEADKVERKIKIVTVPASRSRVARLPLPPTHFVKVIGPDEILKIASETKDRLKLNPVNFGRTHALDVHSFLNAELAAAYEFLSTSPNDVHWEGNQLRGLAEAIRRQDWPAVKDFRDAFLESSSPKDSITTALAWAILVESTLLNQRLDQDMQETATAKGCACVVAGGEPFCGPKPSATARAAFNEYVRCRWPIHVFAIDPVTQDQNVFDSFSRRRELQLALAVSVARGETSAENLTRFARRLELDLETIALNRTVVGFSHGNETFGWRFYPRVQSPPIEGNFTVAFRDLLMGGPTRNQERRLHQLEPGRRELTAVVVMPSFVPYATFDMSGNWFKLTNPKWRQLTTSDTVELSEDVKTLENLESLCIAEAHRYRDGEVDRLMRRVKQLEARLPLQTHRVQIPYENTLGGFEMFSSGVTDLAPELHGWYGAPGIDPKLDTVLFLVGDNFSVHETRVVAGNRDVSDAELLSRQIIRVKIPKGVVPVPDSDSVDVHVATPYGITNHLLIPTTTAPAAPTKSGFTWDPDTVVMYHRYNADGFFEKTGVQLEDPKTIKIAAPANTRAGFAEIEISMKTKESTPHTFEQKVVVTQVPFVAGKFILTGGKFRDFEEKATAEFVEHFRYSQRPAEDVELTATLKIDGSTTAVTVDESLTIQMIER